jgi:hypothetical protein
MKKTIARRIATFLAASVALSSIVACSTDTGEAEDGPLAPVENAPPVKTETTAPAAVELTSESSASLICTLCKAQGCLCAGDRCVACGYRAP